MFWCFAKHVSSATFFEPPLSSWRRWGGGSHRLAGIEWFGAIWQTVCATAFESVLQINGPFIKFLRDLPKTLLTSMHGVFCNKSDTAYLSLNLCSLAAGLSTLLSIGLWQRFSSGAVPSQWANCQWAYQGLPSKRPLVGNHVASTWQGPSIVIQSRNICDVL